ncbi:hypothetical protein EA473_02405 [Natrarchaeobius chitinivorans]|uniref:Uncharacterized protein n=1 Tax=Natrarchaeobius chitinivorans TaxID=1679083 RepID=A0A3N6MLA2_NATCH|nr:hypothetical protein EA473_02405 [Natrarchaeobius chitinivorans]
MAVFGHYQNGNTAGRHPRESIRRRVLHTTGTVSGRIVPDLDDRPVDRKRVDELRSNARASRRRLDPRVSGSGV